MVYIIRAGKLRPYLSSRHFVQAKIQKGSTRCGSDTSCGALGNCVQSELQRAGALSDPTQAAANTHQPALSIIKPHHARTDKPQQNGSSHIRNYCQLGHSSKGPAESSQRQLFWQQHACSQSNDTRRLYGAQSKVVVQHKCAHCRSSNTRRLCQCSISLDLHLCG